MEKKLIYVYKYFCIIIMILLMFSDSEATEEIISNGSFKLNESTYATFSFKRTVNDSLSHNNSQYGYEVLEITSKTSGDIIFNLLDDYVNRDNVVVNQGNVTVLNIKNYPNEFIKYEREIRGVGTGAGGGEETYIIIGWNGYKVDKVFEIKTYEYSYIKQPNRDETKSESENWQAGEFKTIKRNIEFVDYNNDGKDDIKIIENIYYKKQLSPNTIRSSNVYYYIWDGIKFTSN